MKQSEKRHCKFFPRMSENTEIYNLLDNRMTFSNMLRQSLMHAEKRDIAVSVAGWWSRKVSLNIKNFPHEHFSDFYQQWKEVRLSIVVAY